MEALTKRQKTRIKSVLAAGLFFLAYVLHPISLEQAAIALEDSAGSAMGYLSANRDISRGKIEVEAYGLRSEGSDKLLEKRYGIKIRSMGCVVSYYQMGYERSYREAVAKAFRRKYGRDVFQECDQDARKNLPASTQIAPSAQ